MKNAGLMTLRHGGNREFSRVSFPGTALAVSLLAFCSVAGAQTREKGPWWPNARWGAGDQAGASNWITPEKVLAATSLVKTG